MLEVIFSCLNLYKKKIKTVGACIAQYWFCVWMGAWQKTVDKLRDCSIGSHRPHLLVSMPSNYKKAWKLEYSICYWVYMHPGWFSPTVYLIQFHFLSQVWSRSCSQFTCSLIVGEGLSLVLSSIRKTPKRMVLWLVSCKYSLNRFQKDGKMDLVVGA